MTLPFCFVALARYSQVILNNAQAASFVQQMDPTNTKGLVQHFMHGDSDQSTRTANRFPSLQLCSPIASPEDVHVIHPPDGAPPLEYTPPEHHITDVRVKKSLFTGRTSLLGTVVGTVLNTAMYPVHKLKDASAGRTANKRDEAGLPSYGDFVLRRFVVVTLEPASEIHPPYLYVCYSSFGPDDSN